MIKTLNVVAIYLYQFVIMSFVISSKRHHGVASGAKAHCSAHGSPSGWRNESASTDFHVL